MSEIYTQLSDGRIPLKEIAESDSHPDSCHIIWNSNQHAPQIIDGQVLAFSEQDKCLDFLGGYRTSDIVEPLEVEIPQLRKLLTEKLPGTEVILDPYFD